MVRLPRIAALAVSAVLVTACGDEASSDAQAPPEGSKATKSTNPLPPLDTKEMTELLEAAEATRAQFQAVFAAGVLAKLEKGRLPPVLLEGLKALTKISPEHRSSVTSKVLEENIALFNAACDNAGIATLKAIAAATADQRTDVLWAGCKFERHGLSTREAVRGYDDTGAILAHMALVHLETNGGVAPVERKMLGLLLKLPND